MVEFEEQKESINTALDRIVVTAEHMQEHIISLEAQVQFCVDYMNDHDMLDEHCFTFPDGETVWATKTLDGEKDAEESGS